MKPAAFFLAGVAAGVLGTLWVLKTAAELRQTINAVQQDGEPPNLTVVPNPTMPRSLP